MLEGSRPKTNDILCTTLVNPHQFKLGDAEMDENDPDFTELDRYDAQLDKHMLRPMAYWRVPVGNEEDDTPPKKPSAVQTQSVAMSLPFDKDSVSRSGTAAVDQVFENDNQQQASPHHRHHYRIISNDPMRRQTTMHELFHGRTDVTKRGVFLRDFNRLPDAQSYLSPSFGPALEILTELADVLTTAYTHSEKKYPAGIDDQYFMVHNDFLPFII
ncbi:hypothetical protein GGU10DRAFT_376312 [Lentinula aff. detonsa]|uniref:Uncharacterized protein n=1 Tax=Lentinula aff. detonsa TaxID=2804958 RepID=A0AA38NLT6_9AGAR|nr:hypothetical protein GGU10DRAFT_376312 [Lentinula aff. detonsa]